MLLPMSKISVHQLVHGSLLSTKHEFYHFMHSMHSFNLQFLKSNLIFKPGSGISVKL